MKKILVTGGNSRFAKILRGTKPSEIPITANYRWNLYVNEGLLNAANVKLPPDIFKKAQIRI